MLSGTSQAPPAPSAGAALQAGQYVCGVKLEEVVFEGGGLRLWTAGRRDGRKAVVWLMLLDVPELREHFCGAAKEMSERARELDGVLKVTAVDAELGAYAGDFDLSHTLADKDHLDHSLNEALDYSIKLGEMLTTLHDNGIVHGCLRPEYILVGNDGETVISNAKGFDVGELCRTDPAAVVLFQNFSPPEQRFGGAPSVKTDTFSLGRILHMLLVHDEPKEKDENLPRLDVLDKVPNGVRRMVRACVAGDIDKRYDRPQDLIDDIPRFRKHEPVGLPHPAFDRAAALEKVQKARAEAIAEGRVHKGPEAVMLMEETSEGLTRGKRIGLVILGLLIIIIPSVIAGATANDNIAFSMVTFLSAIPIGVAVPGFGNPKTLGKALVATALLGALVFGDPARRAGAAELGSSGLKSPDVAERLATFKELRAGGEVNLRKVNLDGQDLSSMDLAKASLDGCSFKNARLGGANLQDASLWNVDFEGADVTGANFIGTNPTVFRNWAQAKCNDLTRMPQGWGCVDDTPQLVVNK